MFIPASLKASSRSRIYFNNYTQMQSHTFECDFGDNCTHKRLAMLMQFLRLLLMQFLACNRSRDFQVYLYRPKKMGIATKGTIG